MSYDENIEKAVLYYLIFEQEEADIQVEDFKITKHQQIAKAILELKQQKEEINLISIKNKIDSSKTEILKYISEIAESRFGTSFEYAYKQLINLSKKRRLIKLNNEQVTELNELADDDVETYIEKYIKSLNEINLRDKQEESFTEQISNTMKEIEQKYNNEYSYDYFTGIFDLDKVTNGLHKEELTIIGARPGMGKTTFALQIAEKIARNGIRTAIVSLEMSETQIIQKIISKNARIDSNKIRSGNLDEQDIIKVGEILSKINDLPITINTKVRSIQDIEIFARRMKNKKNLGLLIIDYLQLIKNKNKLSSREQEVSEISRTLKLLSLELKIPIVALCQLNRNAVRNEPELSDLRESGAIEQDADNVIFIFPKEESEERKTVEDVIVALKKQRAGGLTRVTVRFDKKVSEFRNLERM